MNLRDAYKNTVADFEAGNAVQWQGPPGFGKSDKVKRLAQWMAQSFAGQTLGVATIFMATSSPLSFIGLPWKGERTVNWQGQDHKYTVTDPAIPAWYMAVDLATGEVRPANLFDRVLLVIEEWGQGDAETKRAGAELLINGGVGGTQWYLPKGSFRLALSNNDKRDGITKEFDFVINRRAEYTITGDVDVWLADFADKPYEHNGRQWLTLPSIKAWAKRHPETLFEAKPKEQGPWCTPRALAMVDRYTQVVAAQYGGKPPLNDPLFQEGVTSKIGQAAGTSLIGDLQFSIDLPQYEVVVADPTGTEVPQKADLLMLMAYEMAGRTQPADLGQVIQYIGRMPKDMSITYVSSLLRRNYNAFINEAPMKAWIAKNAALVSVIQSISAH
jgi:hypothetical protein